MIPHKIRADGGHFVCPACHGQHQRYPDMPDDDGVEGGQGRDPSSLRDGYVYFMVAIVGILCILGAAVWFGCRR